MKALLALIVLAAALPALAEPSRAADASVKRGRYLIHIAGCNDCHTPAYAMRDGKVPAAGKPAPAYLPPDRVPPQPYAQFP